MIFLSSAFFSKSTLSKTSFRHIICVSNSLDPDQARQIVGPDLDPNRCRDYQQETLAGIELNPLKNIM